MTEHASPDGFRIRGVHVLAALIAFFAVTFAVNTAFITLAVRSFPGTTTEHSFKRGLAPDFNRERAEHAVQATRGWSAQLDEAWEPAQRQAAFRVRMTDADGAPVSGLTLTADLRRSVTSRDDVDLIFAPLGDGLYEASASDVGEGQWELVLRTRFPDGASFIASKDLWLR